MRLSNSKNWPGLIPQITRNFNERKHHSLGGLRPIDLNSKEKAVKLDRFTSKVEPTFEQNQASKARHLKEMKIKPGDYVFVHSPKKRPRGFEIQVSQFTFRHVHMGTNLNSVAFCTVLCSFREQNPSFPLLWHDYHLDFQLLFHRDLR